MRREIFILILLVAVAFLSLGGYLWYTNWKTSIMQIPPKAPSNLVAESLSSIEIKLTWIDNSKNELGFHVMRDGQKVDDLTEGSEEYVDTGLRPATNYSYEIKAYNQAGESDIIVCSVKTLNPPIRVWIDKIGVHDNGEEGELFREFGRGEVHVGVVVTDNNTTIQIHLPKKGHYSLKRDEVTGVGVKVFDTKEVGAYLRLVVIGYEDDGGFGEQLIYRALDMATTSYIGGPTSILLKLSGVDFAKIYSEIFGAEDDWLGTYVSEWTSSNNWGVGEYVDVQCKKEDGNVGLRLWFRVECPIYDYPSEQSIPQ